MRSLMVFAFAGLVLGGCAAPEVSLYRPLPGVPVASIAFIPTVNVLSWDHPEQQLSAFISANCSTIMLSRIGRVYLGSPGQVDGQLTAGTKVFLRATSFHTETNPRVNEVTMTTHSCSSMVSFVPQAGEAYQVRHYRTGAECRAEVTNRAGSAPPDLEVLDAPADCVSLGSLVLS
ncbi:MAG: hypothetical protein REJ23_07000 [Brevundimonas sp.]|nr:hypothetical protein [Brevundimonas sp.]